MTTIAILSDIHGNMTAFSAVIQDAKAHQADEYWFLGDLFLPGPGSDKLWATLHGLKPTHIVKGNWDDDLFWVLDGPVDLSQPTDVYFSRLVAYLWPHLTAENLATIRNWPLHEVFEQDGLIVSLAHHTCKQPLTPTMHCCNSMMVPSPILICGRCLTTCPQSYH